jgi:site-specific recombinase XerD
MGTESDDGNDGGDEIPEYSPEEMGISEKPRKGVVDQLVPLEEEMYKQWRLDFARWAFDRGREPYFGEGFSRKSMKNILNRVERFVEWQYSRDGFGFTLDFTEDHVEAFWDTLRINDNMLRSNRRTINNVSLVLRQQGIDWEIPERKKINKKLAKETSADFTDYFKTHELDKVRAASLRAYAIPRREEMDSGEQDEWASHLAQRLRKPKRELTDDDWERANSLKIPSLVYVSRDVGFRPTEVEESRMSWIIINDEEEDGSFKIPKDEDSKDGKNNWTPYLSDEATRVLRMWMEERANNPKYDDRDEIWLTREGNPYSADSLREVMIKLMVTAGIDRSNRECGWYMMRRGVGTELANAKGVLPVMSQLRINNVETARRYVQSDEEAIRDWLNNR